MPDDAQMDPDQTIAAPRRGAPAWHRNRSSSCRGNGRGRRCVARTEFLGDDHGRPSDRRCCGLSGQGAWAADGTVRVNITLPERLLGRIDERAENRSAFLARAAEKALADA